MKSNSKPTKFSEKIQTATFLDGPLMLSCDLSFMFVDEPYSNMKGILLIIKENCDFEVGNNYLPLVRVISARDIYSYFGK